MESAPKAFSKAEYDPNDIWDAWLIKKYGKESVLATDEDTEAQKYLTGDDLLKAQYENAVDNSEGDIIDPDGNHFGSFAAADGTVVVERPENIRTPEESERFLDGSSRVRLDFCVHFQVDGPGTGGHMWQSRLFDQVTKEEVPGSRFLANKLSYVISSAMAILPKNATEYVSVEDFFESTIIEAGAVDRSLDYEEEETRSIKKEYPDYEPLDLAKLLMDEEEEFSDIFMQGNLVDYIQRNIESLNEIPNEDERMSEARKFRKHFAKLMSVFYQVNKLVNDNKFQFLSYKGEDFVGGDEDEDEPDEWNKE